MVSLPAADKPFPILDRIVLNPICGENKPLACTRAQWLLTHSNDTIFQHRRIHYSAGVQTQTIRVKFPPDAVLLNEDKYVMARVPHKAEDVRPLVEMQVQPGYVLDDQLKDRFGLAENGQYGVYHVHHPKNKMGKVMQLFSSAMPPDEYTIIFDREAYKQLAMKMLEKLADASQAKDILGAPSAASLKLDYKNPQSEAVAKIRKVVENAEMNPADITKLTDEAISNQHYEFAAALREIAADLFPEAGYKHRDAIVAENKAKSIGGGQSPA